MKGIDVSYHNGVIDWKKVKQSGAEKYDNRTVGCLRTD